jgi:hypothetical protein
MAKSKPLTPAERKRAQITREKAAGWTHTKVKVAPEHADAVRAFARSLPSPAGQELPGQQAFPLFNQ